MSNGQLSIYAKSDTCFFSTWCIDNKNRKTLDIGRTMKEMNIKVSRIKLHRTPLIFEEKKIENANNIQPLLRHVASFLSQSLSLYFLSLLSFHFQDAPFRGTIRPVQFARPTSGSNQF